MNDRFTYAIIKTYKGIFKKKHVGNTQLIFIPTGSNFILLELLGEHVENDNEYWAVKRIEGPIEFMDSLIMELKETSTTSMSEFLILDQIECKTKEVDPNHFVSTLKSLGQYLKEKSYDIRFERDYSKTAPIFLLKGKITIEFTDTVNKNNVNMVSLKKDAKIKSQFKALKLKSNVRIL